MKPGAVMRVHIQGSGKVGRALRKHLRRARWPVSLRPAREGPPSRVRADVIVLAVRDGQLEREAERWREAGVPSAGAVVLHVAGALDAEVLAVLRPHCAGVGQMHPLVSFASDRRSPNLEGAFALVSGDRAAVRAGKRLAAALGMHPRLGDGVDRTAYHAAAWMVAGGAVALSAAARDLLVRGGFDAREAERMLAPLIRSIAENVGAVGLPHALTGVVRRGDAATLRRHAEALERHAPEHLALYLSTASAQIPMARALGDASAEALEGLEAELEARSAAMAGRGAAGRTQMREKSTGTSTPATDGRTIVDRIDPDR